jgi:hypothetical protein
MGLTWNALLLWNQQLQAPLGAPVRIERRLLQKEKLLEVIL